MRLYNIKLDFLSPTVTGLALGEGSVLLCVLFKWEENI